MPDNIAATTRSQQKVGHARLKEPVLVKGRREFFQYRDLGVAQASGGGMRAQVMMASQGLSQPTGWHYHECEGQFIYIIKGWVDLEFEDGRTIRVEQGDSLYIPGHMRHTEIIVRVAKAAPIPLLGLPYCVGGQRVACLTGDVDRLK